MGIVTRDEGSSVERVAPEDDEVRELAGLERAFLVLLERGVGAVQRAHAQRLLDTDLLARSPGLPPMSVRVTMDCKAIIGSKGPGG